MAVQRTIFSIIFILLMLCLSATSSQAGKAGFSWLSNNDPSLAGYKIHYGTTSRNYTFVINVGLPEVIDGRVQAEINGLLDGQTYYFAATAYTDTGESDYSTEVAYQVPITDDPVPPVAHDINLQGNENQQIFAQLNIDNPAGATLQYTVTTQPAHGTLTIEDATGSFTYSPVANFSGVDSFTYNATNSAGISNTATVTLTIIAINEVPVANNVSITVDEGVSHSDLLSATDNDNDPLTYSLVTPPTKGTANLDQDGSFSYTPDSGVSGSDSFTYKVFDGTASSDTATVAITITSPVDEPQVGQAVFSWLANNDPALTGYKIHYGTISRNYSSVVDVGLPEIIDGRVQAGVDGLQVDQTYYFAATAYSDAGESDYSSEVVYTVQGTGTPALPVANDLALQGTENTSITAQLDVDNPAGAPLQYTVTAQPSHGTLTVEDATGSFTYTPISNYAGIDTFTYTATNSTGVSNIATVTLNIIAVNNTPVASNTVILVDEDSSHTGQLSATDSDGDLLTYSLVNPPTKGTVNVSQDGSYSYTPDPSVFGSDSFSYKVSDSTVDSNTATVTVTINPVNDAPIASNTTITLNENSTHSGQLSATDNDNDPLTFVLVSGPSNGTANVNQNGAYIYIPQTDVSGNDSFTYKVSDGTAESNTATVNVTITPVNDAPVANNIAFTVNEESTHSGQLSATDNDGDPVSYILVTAPSKGTASVGQNGAFTYIPQSGVSGSDSFTFKVTDGTVDSNIATATITIISPDDESQIGQAVFSWLPNNAPDLTGYKIHYGTISRNYTVVSDVGLPEIIDGRVQAAVDGLVEGQTYYFAATAYSDAGESDYSTEVVYTVPGTGTPALPVAHDMALQGNENNPISAELNVNNSEGTGLQYTVVSPPAHGTVTVEETTGFLTYNPASGYNGTDTFTYTAANSMGVSNIATVTLDIIAVNDTPVASNAVITVEEDGTYSSQLSATDSDDDPLTYFLVTPPTKGTASIIEDGAYSYAPNPGMFGNDTFTYKVSDGTLESIIATISVTISPVNDAPVATNTAITVNEDSSHSGQLSGTDSDGDPITYTLLSTPAKGTANVNQSGIYAYTPQPGVYGSDSFTYQVTDGKVASNTGTITVTIIPVNDAPFVQNSTITLDQGGVYNGQLTATDEDGDGVTFFIAAEPENGDLTLNENGIFIYTPATGVNGNDSFTFKVSDGHLESNTGTVDITINEVIGDFAFEIGELQVTSEWQTVTFDTDFVNPAVVAKTGAISDMEPGTIRIRNLTSAGFDIRFQEWDYLDGVHPAETVAFMAMERGYHQINEDIQAIAYCTDLSGLDTFQYISFSNPLSRQPVVLASVVTENEQDAVTLRMRDVTSDGFDLTLQEQESSDGTHIGETACFIAWEQWTGMLDNIMVEVAATDNSLIDTSAVVPFKQMFPERPFTLAGQQSANGMNTATLGISHLSVTEAGMMIIEETSADSEIGHISETGGYIAVAPYKADDDSDHDGLNNGEELEINSHPGLSDTDQDGLNDGEEYDYWMNNGLSPDSDSDNDGLANLLDRDSDNDGSSDGTEINAGFDPADPTSLPTTSLSFEVGEIEVDSTLVRVNFQSPFIQPVIIANIVTRNDTSPCVVRISDVNTEGFNIQVKGYDYLGTNHGLETVSYIVIEKGSYTLDDGTQVEAGLFDTNATTSVVQALQNQFAVAPVVLTSIVTSNDPEAVVGRIQKIATTGFEYRLQEQEANAKYHGMETVAYLAWTPGTGMTNGIRFEAGKTTDNVTHGTFTINFNQQFPALPFHFAGMQTTDGGDTAAVKIVQAGSTGMEVTVEEEASRDSEISHTKEVAGFLILLPE